MNLILKNSKNLQQLLLCLLPLALVMAKKQNTFNKGELIYLIGTGAGLSIASTLIKV